MKQNKILEGAKEALAVARGENMPAKVTAYGWGHWHPQHGIDHFIYSTRGHARLSLGDGWRVVRVKVETF